MVWGMAHPKSGGAYGPYGEYEGPVDHYGGGWKHRLEAHFRERMTDAEQAPFRGPYSSYSGWVWSKLIYEPGTKPEPERPPLAAIADHEPPRFYQIEKGFKELASIISLPGCVWAVSEPAKVLIERVEPGSHQFYPIEIRMPRGKTYPTLYYTIVFGRYLDSFAPELSRPESVRKNGDFSYHLNDSKAGITGLALRKSVYGTAQLWRERRFGEWLACFSDRLMADLASAELLLPKHYRMMDV